MSGSWPQGLETAAAHAADHVEPDAVGGRVEQPPVGGELLQGAHPGGGAEDGHAVAGLHFLVDELCQRLPDAGGTVERQTEIVHH